MAVASATIFLKILFASMAFVILLLALYILYKFLRILICSRGHKCDDLVSPILVIAIFVGFVLIMLPVLVDVVTNRIKKEEFLPITSEASELHKKLFIADLHSDSLLWERDLLLENRRGHVDLPRMQKGNIGLQFFILVTKSPSNLNFVRNEDPVFYKDDILLKALIERWGADCVKSYTARAMYMINKLKHFEAHSAGELMIVKSKADLLNFLRLKKEPQTKNIVAAMLGVEGMHALDGKVENIDLLYEEGVRMMATAHFFDNEVSGSAHGVNKGGLTELGRKMIKRMTEKGMIIDIAHNSQKTIDEIFDLTQYKVPIVSSHTGVTAVCDIQRNLNDRTLQNIAKSGGLIGVAFFEDVFCDGNMIQGIVSTMIHLKNLPGVGVDFIALGSDWDGSVTVSVESSNIVHLTNALLATKQFSEIDIEKIMGGNVRRFLLNNLK